MNAMTQTERRLFLIRYLLAEAPQYADAEIPSDEASQKQLLRALMNVRPANPASDEFLAVQDAYLREVIRSRGIVQLSDLTPKRERRDGNIYLWRGDITTLCVDGIVNALCEVVYFSLTSCRREFTFDFACNSCCFACKSLCICCDFLLCFFSLLIAFLF